MKIAISSDHGGFELKNFLVKWLQEEKLEVIDLGNHIYDKNDDYPDFARLLAETVAAGKADKGITICGSGIGACITANKVKGARASVCHDTYSAHQGVEHDKMNVLCIGARIIGIELAKEIVTAFIKAEFINEDRFRRRFDKVIELENRK
ncbi:MAG: ribose 5-phosphate isomerase B [Ignavibacteriaceae bacterium]|nr:ribose 5-phosphate isomerase B [Ignavibacteriaceae bacterium]